MASLESTGNDFRKSNTIEMSLAGKCPATGSAQYSEPENMQSDQLLADTMQPPIRVVVVREIKPPFSGISSGPFSLDSSSHYRTSPPKTTIEYTTSPLFTLQPRNPIHFATSTSNRGRKRPATSISSAVVSSSTEGASVDEKSASFAEKDETNNSGSLYSNDTSSNHHTGPVADGVSNAAFTLQSLSLHSPGRHPLRVETLEKPPPNGVGGSCFSKYTSSSSPSRPLLRRPPHHRLHATRMSSSPGSTRSSPKIASLTVLSHNRGAAAESSPTKFLPPLRLPGEGLSGAAGAISFLPPSSIQCSIRSDTSVSTSFSTINAPDEEETDETGTDRRNGASRKETEAFMAESPCRSVTSRLDRTPLPSIALTPRSQVGRRDHVPQFPSPSGDDELTSPFLPTREGTCGSSACTGSSAVVNLNSFGFAPRSNLLDPQTLFAPSTTTTRDHQSMANVSDLHRATAAAPGPTNSQDGASSPTAIRSRSLLKPSTSNNSMLAMLEGSTTAGVSDPFGDSGSLCTSDDEDAFFLIPPSTVGVDHDDTNHRVKHRRVQSSSSSERKDDKVLPSFPSFGSHHESSSSLYGSGLLTSASANSLFAMDHDSLRTAAAASNQKGGGGSAYHCLSTRFAPAEGSTTSSRGMMLPSMEVKDNDTNRDLVTPPVMQQPNSPPPLSSQRSGGEVCAESS